MEPGRRDREQTGPGPPPACSQMTPQWSPVDVTGNSPPYEPREGIMTELPQWSPVDVTGNSWTGCVTRRGAWPAAAMEPGRRDREQAGAAGHIMLVES